MNYAHIILKKLIGELIGELIFVNRLLLIFLKTNSEGCF
jgi:hypothetical protein